MLTGIYELILGDWGTYNETQEQTVSKNVSLIFFYLGTFFLMLIMMNLLIAILSDSYARVSAAKDC